MYLFYCNEEQQKSNNNILSSPKITMFQSILRKYKLVFIYLLYT